LIKVKILSKISSRDSSSASALKFGIILCLNTGLIINLTSLISGVKRPLIRAHAFAALINIALARGPAPQFNHFL